MVKYLAVGCTALLIHLAVLQLLIQVAGFPPVAASAAGFGTACVVNYWLQHTFVFRSDQTLNTTASRYLCVTSIMLLMNSILFAAFTTVAGLAPTPAQVLVTGGVFVVNFYLNKYFTFGNPSLARSRPERDRNVPLAKTL